MIKKYCFSFFIMSCIYFLIRYPLEAMQASKDGLSLWLHTLIPTLLPFLIFTEIFLNLSGFTYSIPFFTRFCNIIFGLSPSGFYCLMIGLLCGYPMGAKMASDFYAHSKISKQEAEYLLTMSCNPSPAFLINYLYLKVLKKNYPLHAIFLPLLLADIFSMILFRFYYHQKKSKNKILPVNKNDINTDCKSKDKKETPRHSPPGAIIDVSIMNGFETITRLGGYILLFSIFSAIILHYWPFTEHSSVIVLGFTELITGLNTLSLSDYPLRIQYFLSMLMTGFGGFCIYFQTHSIWNPELKFWPYFVAKLLQVLFLAIWILLLSNYF